MVIFRGVLFLINCRKTKTHIGHDTNQDDLSTSVYWRHVRLKRKNLPGSKATVLLMNETKCWKHSELIEFEDERFSIVEGSGYKPWLLEIETE